MKRNTWKKTIAFVLAFTLVAGTLPANVGGFLTGGTEIVAKAGERIYLDTGSFKVGTTLDPHNTYEVAEEHSIDCWVKTSDFHDDWKAHIQIGADSEVTVECRDIDTCYGNEKYYKVFYDFGDETIVLKTDKEMSELDALLRIKSGTGTENDPFVFEVIDCNTITASYAVTPANGIEVYNGDNKLEGDALNAVSENTVLKFMADDAFAVVGRNGDGKIVSYKVAEYDADKNKYIASTAVNQELSAEYAGVQITSASGETNFGTDFVEAVQNAETGSTIKLLKNITIDDMPGEALEVTNKTLTLDLNGKTLSCDKYEPIYVSTNEEENQNKGNLTITDTSSGKNGTININLATSANATLTIEHGTINGMRNNGTTTIEDGTFNDMIWNSRGTTTIKNGIFKKWIVNAGPGEDAIETVNIEDGTFESGVLNNTNGAMTIKGGTFKGATSSPFDNESQDIYDLFGVPCSVFNYDSKTLTIENGAFENAVVSIGGQATIQDGTFKKQVISCSGIVGIYTEEAPVTINGGTFEMGVANGFKKKLEETEDLIELKGTTTIAGGKFQADVTNTLGTVTLAGGVFATKPDDATNGKTLAAQKKLFALTPQTITAEQPVSYKYGVGSIDDFVLRDITESYKKDNYTLTATAPTTGTSIEGYGIDLSYQWAKKNTTNDSYDDISGATSNTHNVKNVADSGDYRCTIMSGDAVIQQLDANVAISKSGVPVTAPTAKNDNLIFNNMDQELISEGTATDGTLYYMLADKKPAAEDEGWTADARTIKGKNVGSYQVWYKAVATDTANRTDFAVVDTPLTVQINKADIPSADITAPQAITGLFYTPAEQALIKAGSVKGGKMQYAVTAEDVHTAPQDANAWQDTVPKKKAIGTYRIWYKAVPDDTENFNESTPESFTVVINKSDITTNDFIAPATLNPTYNSSPVQLVSAGKVPDGCTMYYMISSKQPALDAAGWETDVTKITADSTGTYYVWYKVDGATNYNNLTAQSVKVTVSQYVAPSSSTTITQVGQSWTLTMDSYKYDGTAHTPTIDGTTYGGVTYTYYNADTNEKLAEAPSAVGNYKVKVYAPGNASYYGRSQTATYSITEAEPVVNVLNIDEQPKDVTCMIGEMAVFTVKASGENLTYQWEFNSGYGWRTSTMNGANTDTISIPMSELRNGQQYRCIVKSGNDAVTSEAAAMYAASCITEQPKDCSGAIGDTAKFTVKALGEVKSYQWQYNKGNGWENSGMTGYDTATVEVPFIESRNGQQYRCIVTFTDGTTQISEVGAMQVKPCIVEQSKDCSGVIGDTAKFTVKAFGEVKSYRWQYNKGNGLKYSDMSGYDTATVEVPLIRSRDGQQYRCIITTADGTMLVTSAVTMSVEK